MARARAITSSAVARPGSITDSRQTIASLFRLRRWLTADAFNRTYISSGMFFKVRVVGTVLSESEETITVALWSEVYLRPNPFIGETFAGLRPPSALMSNVRFRNQVMDARDKRLLVSRIEKAWSGVASPADEHIFTPDSYDDEDITAYFCGTTWRGPTAAALRAHCPAISVFFTPVAFH